MFVLDIRGKELEEALSRPSLPQEQGRGLCTRLSQIAGRSNGVRAVVMALLSSPLIVGNNDAAMSSSVKGYQASRGPLT